MTLRITVLCENTVGPISGTLGEHGFAALIEPANGEPLLFDTGQGATLQHNARRMNKDLANIRKMVISHGHHDHCGGLLPLLQKYGPSQILAHPGIFSPRFRVKDNGEYVSIGIPHNRNVVEETGATFNLSASFREIAPGMFLTGEIPRSVPFEIGDRGLYCDCTGQQPDSTPDDQSLILETGKGLVLVLGCCHAGLVNTLEHVTNNMGRRGIYAIIGGTHLGFCGRKQVDNTVSALKETGIRKLAAGHCTGFAASARLSYELPKIFQPAHVGYTLEV
jgi:7,8-dihydropterin-6-yl-methyl-4-(beta-D-ribofuranosyl)aminobenzene 5'-phosphate synthase